MSRRKDEQKMRKQIAGSRFFVKEKVWPQLEGSDSCRGTVYEHWCFRNLRLFLFSVLRTEITVEALSKDTGCAQNWHMRLQWKTFWPALNEAGFCTQLQQQKLTSSFRCQWHDFFFFFFFLSTEWVLGPPSSLLYIHGNLLLSVYISLYLSFHLPFSM